MGGYGSGRGVRFDPKKTVEGKRSIDIRDWHREGLLVPGNSFHRAWFQWTMGFTAIKVWVESDRAMVAFDAQAEVQDCVVWLCTTPCNYGGERYWFRCPTKGCKRRTAVLYIEGRSFACRHCLDLAYPSQRDSPGFRAARRASKIRRKLGGSGALPPPFPEKPKGMHLRTYQRLRQRAEEMTAQFSDELGGRVEVLEKRLNLLRANQAESQARERK